MDHTARTEARQQALAHLVSDAAAVAAELNAALREANRGCRTRTIDSMWDTESVERLLFAPARERGEAQYSEGHSWRVPNSYRGRATATTQDIYVYCDRQGLLYVAHDTGRSDVPSASRGAPGPDAISTRHLAACIDPRLSPRDGVRARRRARLRRRRVRDVRRWWAGIAPRVDARQRAQVRRHLAPPRVDPVVRCVDHGWRHAHSPEHAAACPYGPTGERPATPAELAKAERLADGVRDAWITTDARGALLVIRRTGGIYTYCIVADATHPERLHALPVPPDTESCTAGLAWCARMTVEQYQQLAIEA
jgi:hypothetical protein